MNAPLNALNEMQRLTSPFPESCTVKDGKASVVLRLTATSVGHQAGTIIEIRTPATQQTVQLVLHLGPRRLIAR